MLKLYDSSKNFIKDLTVYSDDCIESDLHSGDQTLSFTFPGKIPELINECYIRTSEAEYVVKEMHPQPEGTECICQLNLEDLEREKFEQFTAKDKTVTEAAALALAGTGWTVQTDIEKQRSVQTFLATPLTILGLIRDAFMCEMRFDNINRVVIFAEEFGEYRGMYFRRSLNLRKASITIDTYDYYTRLVPIGADNLRITAVNDGKDYVENYQYTNKIRTMIWEDTSYEDAETLKEDAIAKLNDLSKPKKSYEAEIIDLAKQRSEYSLLSYHLGDSVDIVDELTGVMDRQRIVKLKEYPHAPEQNTCELSNTVLTWEEMQDRLDKAASAWEDATNSDGTIKGVYVHGVQAGDVVGIETVVNDTINTNETVNQIRIDLTDTQDDLEAAQGDIGTLQSNLAAVTLRVGTVETTYLKATDAALEYATIASLNATNADVHDLSADYATFKTTATDELSAHQAVIDGLDAKYATISVLEANYATITNLNATNANVQTLSSDYATFKSATTTELSAATANIADLTANKANVSDLTATNTRIDNLGATYATIDLANVEAGSITSAMIGTGVVDTAHIADGSITDAKIVGLTASKITAGTLNAGVIDVVNLNADNITVGTLNGQRIANGAISSEKLSEELSDTIDSAVADTQILYALSTSSSTAPSSGWSEAAPDWEDGKFMWQKTVYTLVDGTVVEKPATCISGATGATGAAGDDAAVLRIDSSKGNMFKNNAVSTVLSVSVFVAGQRITNITALRSRFGAGAYLQWYWRRLNDSSYGTILPTDPMISDDGFTLTLTPDDVDVKVTFMCELVL